MLFSGDVVENRCGVYAGDAYIQDWAATLDAVAALKPRFGDWPVFQHVLPFDVSRAYDELRGIEHPVVWTAERARALWQALRG